MDHNGGAGKLATAAGYTVNANPAPVTHKKSIVYLIAICNGYAM